MTQDMNKQILRRDMEKTCFRKGRALLHLSFLLLMLCLGVTEAWGQTQPSGTDRSGYYYIINLTLQGNATLYDPSNPQNGYYLCPAAPPADADADYNYDAVYYDGASKQMPYLTTYKKGRVNDAVWKIEFVETVNENGNNVDYYYIRCCSDNNKYLTHNYPNRATESNRLTVHLQTTVDGDNSKFCFETGWTNENSYAIRPKQVATGNRHLNPAQQNCDYYYGTTTGNKTATINNKKISVGGMIGYYSKDGHSDDAASQWFLEKAAPIISYNSSNLIEISYIFDEDASIYYSFGEESTPSPSSEGTFSYSETGPFDPPAGTTTIKAIAVKGNEVSGTAIYTIPFLLGSTHSYIIQSKQCQFYNLIPNVTVDENTKYVSTLNVPCTTMAWHFEYAEEGYYYIVDANGWYLYYTTNTNKYIYLKNSKDDTDGFKFKIASHANGGYNIIPKGLTKAIYKNNYGNSDVGLKPVMYDGTIANDVARWDIIPYTTTNLPMWDDSPFDVSTDDVTNYYTITPLSKNTDSDWRPLIINNSEVVNSEVVPNELDERKTLWIMKKVGAYHTTDNPTGDNSELLDYYTIQNAYTGELIYYNGNGNGDGRFLQKATFQMGIPSVTDADETWSHFVIVQTANNGYNIIPRIFVDNVKAIDRNSTPHYGFNCINRSGGNDILGTFYDDGDGSRWTFEEQTDVKCMNPVFTEEANGDITITTVTNAAKILCTIDDVNNPTASSAEYTTKQNTSTQRVIKAIAIIGDDPNTASDVVTLLNKPDITLDAESYTYKGTAWEPTVTKVSIGTSPNETTAPTTPTVPYTASYSGDRTNAGTTTATVTLTDADASDLWYIWNASTTFTISPASVTVTADDQTKEYGTNDPELTATVEGMQNGESATELIHYTISRVAGENVGGTYAITPSGQATQGNYSVTYVPGELTITRKAVTVTADDKEKAYGDADPTLSVTIAGLVNNDSESVISYTISRAEGENVGTYVITPTGATDQGNYTVTYPTGTLTINKKSLTVTANNKSITYGEAPANNGVTYGTFASNEDENDLGGNLTYTYNYAQYEDVGSGSFAITPSGLTSDNYELTFVPGTLTVERKEVGIGEWSNTTVIYNGSAQAPTATVDTNDLINGDEGVEVTVTGGGIDAGSYTATASGLTGGKAGNYKLPNPAPTSPFTINKAQLMTVTLGNNALTYNGTEQTVTITSVTAGDGTVVTVSDVPSEDYDVSGNSATNANTYTVTVTPKSPSTNYETGVSVSESYTINRKSIGDGTDPATANGITINITWNDDESDPYIVEVKDGETLLTKGTDYAFSPSPTGGHDTKYYTVTIAGTNNYKDQFTSQYANVKFDSNGSDGAMYYGTFVAEADHATPEDMTPYIITSVADNTATALALDYIPTGVPIVLMNPTYAKGFLVQSGTGEISTTGNLLEVQATNEEKATAFAYLLYKGEFVLNKAGTFKAGTVYLPVPAGGVSPARLKIIEDDFEDDNTGIENIENTIDSQSGAWYTLDGRSLSSKPTKKGIYLQSGKKIVVK